MISENYIVKTFIVDWDELARLLEEVKDGYQIATSELGEFTIIEATNGHILHIEFHQKDGKIVRHMYYDISNKTIYGSHTYKEGN